MEDGRQKSRMHFIEWVIILCLAVVVDIAQIILNLAFGSGLVINRLVSAVFGIILGGWLFLRGVSLVQSKRLFGFLATIFLEEIPVFDSIPTWTIDVIWTWWTTKSKVAAKVTGAIQNTNGSVNPLNNAGNRLSQPKIPLNEGGSRPPRGGLVNNK